MPALLRFELFKLTHRLMPRAMVLVVGGQGRTAEAVIDAVRLALATRLGVEEGDEDFWMSLPDEDPRTHVHDIYEWVGYLQETLVQALSD